MGTSARWFGGSPGPPTREAGPSDGMTAAQVPFQRTRLLVKLVLAGAAVLLALLIAIPFIVPHQTLPMAIIVFISVFILIAALIAGIAGAYLFMTRAPAAASPERIAPTVLPPVPSESSTRELEHVVLRLLDGDEQEVMRVLLTNHGELLQRDLVRSTSFSDAKVSRLLDKLEGRGLVVRERQGMTNRVRVTLRQS